MASTMMGRLPVHRLITSSTISLIRPYLFPSSSSLSLSSSSSSLSSSLSSISSPLTSIPSRSLILMAEEGGGGKRNRLSGGAKIAVKGEDEAKKAAAAAAAAHAQGLLRAKRKELARRHKERKKTIQPPWRGLSMIDQIEKIHNATRPAPDADGGVPKTWPFKGAIGIRFYRKQWAIIRSGSQELRPFEITTKDTPTTEYTDTPHSYWTVTKYMPKSEFNAKRRVWGIFTWKGRREPNARKIPGCHKKVWRFIPPPYPTEREHQILVLDETEEIPTIVIPTPEEAEKLKLPESEMGKAAFTMTLPDAALPKAIVKKRLAATTPNDSSSSPPSSSSSSSSSESEQQKNQEASA